MAGFTQENRPLLVTGIAIVATLMGLLLGSSIQGFIEGYAMASPDSSGRHDSELESLISQVVVAAQAETTNENLPGPNGRTFDRAQALGMLAAVSATASISLNYKYYLAEADRQIAASNKRIVELKNKKKQRYSANLTTRSGAPNDLSAYERSIEEEEEAKQRIEEDRQQLKAHMVLVSNIMKTSHDSMKAVINNIR